MNDRKGGGETREAVLLLHGLWMNRYAMAFLAGTAERAGYAAHTLTYRSVVAPLDAHLAQLAERIAAIGAPQVHLVGHSLGGIIALRYLQGAGNCRPDPRIGRTVLLGAPVSGCRSAIDFAEWFGGQAMLGRSLGLWRGNFDTALEAHFQVGSIAGTRSLGLGRFVASLPVPNDGVIALEETRLPGLRDHLTLKVNHSGMLISSSVARAMIAFLRQGRFQA